MGMIGVLEITLIVPTLRVGMPLRTLRVRSRMWRRCVPKLQRYPRHALGLLNPQSAISVEADLCITMSAERGHDRVQMPALTLIVPTLQCVGMPPRTLRVRS